MKTKILTAVVVCGFLSISLFTYCNKSQNKIEEAKEEVKAAEQDLKAAEADYLEEVRNFKEETEMKIDENKNQIEILREQRSSRKTTAEKEMYDKKIADIEKRNEELRNKLKEYREEIRTEKWESFKREVNHDVDELSRAIEDIFKDNLK